MVLVTCVWSGAEQDHLAGAPNEVMKKILLVAMGICALSSQLLPGQGTVGLANNSSTLVRDIFGVPIPANGGMVEFFYVPESGAYASTSPSPINVLNGNTGPWEPLAMNPVVAINPLAGFFAAEVGETGNDSPGGAHVWLEALAWTGDSSDFDAAFAAMVPIGFSSVWSNPTGNNAAIPPTPPAALVLGPTGFNGVTYVPEPSTWALGLLGAVLLLLFQRNRKGQGASDSTC